MVPDGFSSEPSIAIYGDGALLGKFPCEHFEPWYVQNRRHETGRVRFEIDEQHVPNMSSYEDLLIVEERTNFPIYRRKKYGFHNENRLFRLETSYIANTKLDKSIRPYFQYWMAGIERFGIETVEYMFRSENVSSIFLSGRVQPRQFLGMIESSYKALVNIPDPVYEFVARVVLLGRLKTHNESIWTAREQASLIGLLDVFNPENTRNAETILRTLSTLNSDTLSPLVTPLTKQLSNSSPSGQLEKNAMVNALDTISQFSSVTLAEEQMALKDTFADIMQIEPQKLETATQYQELKIIADELRTSPLVQSILEDDLILFHYLSQAINRGTEKAKHNSAPMVTSV